MENNYSLSDLAVATGNGWGNNGWGGNWGGTLAVILSWVFRA